MPQPRLYVGVRRIIWKTGAHPSRLTTDCYIRRLCSLHKLSNGGEKKPPAYFHSCDKDSEVNPVFWLESQMERDEGRVAAGRHFEGSHCPLSFM